MTQVSHRAPRPRYTEAEKNIIINNVKSFPDNLEEAFRKSAVQCKRESNSISQYYYAKLKNSNEVLVTVGSSKGFTGGNSKLRANKSDDQKTPMKSQLNPLRTVILEILQFDKAQLESIKILVNNL